MKLVIYQMDTNRRSECFKRIGQWIHRYNGRCYLATDAGTSLDDMVDVHNETPYVLDLPPEFGGVGSFTPMLVKGVVRGLEAAIEMSYKSDSFHNLSAYVLGLGVSGLEIALQLYKEGCFVAGFDIDENKNQEATKLGIQIKKSFFDNHYHIFVPCAVGSIINQSNTEQLKVDIIGGSANHPLDSYADKILFERGVVVIPDFVISSGAILIDDLIVRGKKATIEEGLKRTERIYQFTRRILEESVATRRSPREIALQHLGVCA